MPTVRVVLANAAEQDWEIEHVDVKSTYLNAPLEEVIYMKAPRGVLKPSQEGKVLRLLKGLYGLKQAGRGWYLEMSRVLMKELDYKRSRTDHSVFYKKTEVEHTIVAVTTDDMAVTSMTWQLFRKGRSTLKDSSQKSENDGTSLITDLSNGFLDSKLNAIGNLGRSQ